VLLGGDQAYFWTYAQRILHGERVYRDFFQFTPPGTDLAYAAAFGLFGARLWVTNAVVVALGVALGWCCFRVAVRVMGAHLAALASALFIVLLYGKALNATHHWFSVMAIMSAVAVLEPGSRRTRHARAGALLGLGAFFTQVHGAVALIAFVAFVSWQARRERLGIRTWVERVLLLVGGFAIVFVCTNAYFVVTGRAGQLWRFEVVYVLEHMAHHPLWPSLLSEPATWRRLPWLMPYLLVYVVVPAAYALVFRHCWRARHDLQSKSWNALALSCLVGSLLTVEVAMNPNWLRLFSVAMPGIVLAGWLLGGAGKSRRFVVPVAWLAVVGLGFHHVFTMQAHNALELPLPGGKVVTDSVHRDKLQWLAQRVSPGDFLFAADRPSVYLELGVYNPVFLDTVEPDEQTRPEQATRAVSELDAKQVKYALWSTALDHADAGGGATDGLNVLRRYVHERYWLEQTFPDGEEVWQRR
jgi:hypothetical protein